MAYMSAADCNFICNPLSFSSERHPDQQQQPAGGHKADTRSPGSWLVLDIPLILGPPLLPSLPLRGVVQLWHTDIWVDHPCGESRGLSFMGVITAWAHDPEC